MLTRTTSAPPRPSACARSANVLPCAPYPPCRLRRPRHPHHGRPASGRRRPRGTGLECRLVRLRQVGRQAVERAFGRAGRRQLVSLGRYGGSTRHYEEHLHGRDRRMGLTDHYEERTWCSASHPDALTDVRRPGAWLTAHGAWPITSDQPASWTRPLGYGAAAPIPFRGRSQWPEHQARQQDNRRR